ncbi:MAG: FAD:protein FMN transferase [Acetivibrio ethanolgignens]
MKKRKSLFFIILVILGLAVLGWLRTGKKALQGAETAARSATIFAMDTIMDIKLYGGEKEILTKAEKRIKELEAKLSVTDKNSDIYSLNQRGEAEVSKDTEILLSKALALCEKTSGILDISIYPVVRAWGFTTEEYQVPEEETLRSILEKVDYRRIHKEDNKVRLEQGLEIDLGSVAKGYAADELVYMLRKSGIASALLNLGGNVYALGTKPEGDSWKIAIQNPEGNGPLGVISLSDQAVVTSGSYERYFKDDKGKQYCHIMDPRTGYPADSGLSSVTIISASALYADALSTTLFIKGLKKGIEFWRENRDFEAVFIDNHGKVYITPGLEEQFSFTEDFENRKLQIIS